MNIQKKRIFSGFMAIVMVFAMMCVPAFADSTTITGTYEEPNIQVKVPAQGTAIINPYGLPVQLRENDATSGDLYGTIVGQQIVTKPLAIINEGEVDMKVFANVIGTPQGTIRFATAPFNTATDTNNNIFVYLQMALTDLDQNDATQGDLDPAKFYPLFADWEQPYNAGKDLVVGTRALDKPVQMLILKASGEDKNNDGKLDWQAGSIGMFRLAGLVSEEPRTAWNSASDKFTVVVTFTFKPDLTKATATADKTEIILGGGAGDDSALLTPHLTGGESTDGNILSIEWDDSKLPHGVTLTPTPNAKTATLTVASGAAKEAGNVTVGFTITASNGLTYTGEFKGVKVIGDVVADVEASPSDIEATTGNVTSNLTAKLTVGTGAAPAIKSVTWSLEGTYTGVTLTASTGTTTSLTFTNPVDGTKVKVKAIIKDKNGTEYTVIKTITVTDNS